jgi:hypothetical protein
MTSLAVVVAYTMFRGMDDIGGDAQHRKILLTFSMNMLPIDASEYEAIVQLRLPCVVCVSRSMTLDVETLEGGSISKALVNVLQYRTAPSTSLLQSSAA